MNTDIKTRETETNCPLCGNHCSKDDLRCGKGRRYFAEESEAGEDHYDRHHEGHHERHHERHHEGHHDRHHEGHHEGHHGHHDHCDHHEHHGHHDHCDHHEHHGHHDHCDHHEHHRHHEERHDRTHCRREGRMGRAVYFEDDLTGLFHKCSHELFHQPGRKKGQIRILQILSENNGMTQRTLQEILGIQPGSMSEIVSKLEAKGMLTRSKEEEDKRKVILTLTEAGEERLRQYEEDQKEADFFAPLSEEERQQLEQLLRKLTGSAVSENAEAESADLESETTGNLNSSEE